MKLTWLKPSLQVCSILDAKNPEAFTYLNEVYCPVGDKLLSLSLVSA